MNNHARNLRILLFIPSMTIVNSHLFYFGLYLSDILILKALGKVVLFSFQTSPTVLIVHLVFFFLHQFLKHPNQIIIVWGLFELKTTGITNQLLELAGNIQAQLGQRNAQFFIHYFLVFLLLVVRSHILPR